MCFTVARNPDFSPTVIYIDNVDRFFAGKKKSGADGPARFKKDLITYAKSLVGEENPPVLIIGTTR